MESGSPYELILAGTSEPEIELRLATIAVCAGTHVVGGSACWGVAALFEHQRVQSKGGIHKAD